MTIRLTLGAAGVAAMLASAPMAHAVDAEAAQALAKKEGCLKCHALDKRKEAATLKEIAKKYAGKPDAEATILKQITTGVKVKFEDGTEDEHKTVRTKDKAEIDNLIQWILSVK